MVQASKVSVNVSVSVRGRGTGLFGTCCANQACAAQCFSAAHVCLTTHAAMVAHRLGGLGDSAVGLCIIVVSDLH